MCDTTCSDVFHVVCRGNAPEFYSIYIWFEPGRYISYSDLGFPVFFPVPPCKVGTVTESAMNTSFHTISCHLFVVSLLPVLYKMVI